MDDLANPRITYAGLTAREAGFVACTVCGRLDHAREKCLRCGAALHSRKPFSYQRTLAWMCAGIIFFIPANLYPMLITRTLGNEQQSTIIGGVFELIAYGSYFVAIVVGVASILVPLGKFLVIAVLLASIRRAWQLDPHQRLRLYEITEFIGRWSMIDVFVVAILVALVQLDFVASINPGVAAISFALSVIFTMLAAQSLDPRLIWDSMNEGENHAR